MKQPLTKAEAQEWCATYQHLLQERSHQQAHRTASYAAGATPYALVITPFDDISKWRFFQYYLQFLDAEKALDFYTHTNYDVVVIFRLQRKQEPCKFSYLPLWYFLEQQGSLPEGMLFFTSPLAPLTSYEQ